MSDPVLDLIQVGFIKPIIEKVNGDGIKIDNILRSSGLNHYHLDDNDSYIPVSLVHKFLIMINNEEKIKDFSTYFFPCLHAMNMSKHAQLLVSAPDLLTTCKLSVAYDQVIFTHESISLEINGILSKFTSELIGEYEPGKELLELLNLGLIINSFRIAAGDDWIPLEIHLQHHESFGLETFLSSKYKINVLTGQKATAIIFPTILLAFPMYKRMTEKEIVEVESNSIYPYTLRQKIENILDTHEVKSFPNLEHIAKLCGISIRSLQRRLKEEETTYHNICEDWRFKKAITLLQSADIKINTISEKLGYSNTSNFEHAFRRWTKTTPSNFRKQL